MTFNNSFFFILKVFVISGIISFIIKYVLSNFDLLSQTQFALPIVFVPTIVVFLLLVYRTINKG